MEFLTVFLLTLAGGLLRWLLGWGKTDEPFVVRKFATTVGVTAVAAVSLATLYNYADILTPVQIGSAFLAGYAADKLVGDLYDNAEKRLGGK